MWYIWELLYALSLEFANGCCPDTEPIRLHDQMNYLFWSYFRLLLIMRDFRVLLSDRCMIKHAHAHAHAQILPHSPRIRNTEKIFDFYVWHFNTIILIRCNDSFYSNNRTADIYRPLTTWDFTDAYLETKWAILKLYDSKIHRLKWLLLNNKQIRV